MKQIMGRKQGTRFIVLLAVPADKTLISRGSGTPGSAMKALT
jgi:hypothetical protein